MRNKTSLVLITAGALTVGSSVALAQQFGTDSPAPAAVASDAVVAPPAGPGNRGADHQTSVSALRVHLERGNPGYLEGTDWSSARSFPIAGTNLRGWTFDQPGERCLAVPDPIAEGYGITCDTPEEIAAGKASVLILPPSDDGTPNIVGVLTSGGKTATVETRSGAAAPLKRTGDVYAGTAPSGSRLVTSEGSKAINPPTSRILRPAPSSGR